MNNKSLLLIVLVLVNGCSVDPVVDGAPERAEVNIAAIPDAVPRYEPRTRAGNPSSYEVLGKRYVTLKDSKGFRQRGVASWYGTKFHGRKTANGETYNMYAMTAAHKTLPIPSYVRVTNLNNQRSVVVRVNDRGPFHGGRIIDLSYAAASKLGITRTGTGYVEIEALEPGQTAEKTAKQTKVAQKTTPVGGFYLQLGAFKEKFNAQQLQHKVDRVAAAQTQLKIVQNPTGRIYKVLLGPIQSESQAQRISDKLFALGIKEMSLVMAD
jgi:rare lipoprotein A